MVEQVDTGPIIDVARFPIPAGISVLGLEGLAYAHLAQLFWRMAKSLATDPKAPPMLPIKWGAKKYSRRAYRICTASSFAPCCRRPGKAHRRRLSGFGVLRHAAGT